MAQSGDIAVSAERAPAIIFVARRKWHIDVGFAVGDLSPELAPLARRFPGARYLFFGFGDKHYLLSKNRHAPTILGALLPGPALILVTALENSPQQAFGRSNVLEVKATPAQALGAEAFIGRSLVELVEPYANGPYDESLYFSATGRYSALYTCNTWAADSLRAAGFRLRSRLVLFAGQLWRQVRKIAVPEAPSLAASRSTSRASLPLEVPRGPSLQSQGGGLPF